MSEWINLQLRLTDRPLDEVLAIPIQISAHVAGEEELVKGFLWRAYCSARWVAAERDKERAPA